MSFSRAILLPVGFSVLALAGCSGSGSTGQAHVRCTGTESFCLVSCDLGCGGFGCAVTEVAENQRVQFVFNQDLAPSSIDVSSFSLRTASGEAPLGDTIVDGPRVTFVPLVSVSGGISSFGFRRNETYIITLLGGSQRAIRSVAGDILPQSFTCTITATGGIIDADNARPRATLIAPSNVVGAPTNSTIVLRFSELIDSTPFQTPISPSTPIHYVLRQTRIPTGTTERICNTDSEAIQLEGLPVIGIEQVNGRLVTTISLRPTVTLPSLGCVEVQVTADVRDLAGKGAEEATFRFITEAGVIVDTPLVEDFASPARRDNDVSGGEWVSGAHPAVVGGDGHHGSFSFNNNGGIPDLGGGVYLWSTDSMTIPASLTFSGVDETVTNGEFFFTDLVVPANVRVRFQGNNPLKLHVRGKVEVRGILDASAPAMALFQSRNANPAVTPEQGVPGQPGGLGGPGGARGGAGGNRILLNPDASGNNGTIVTTGSNGNDGLDLALPAGHAYAAQAVGTGGRGAPFFPANPGGLTHVPLPGNGLYSAVISTGGGGGGFALPGGVANAVNPSGVTLPATNAQGGIQFNILPLPTPTTSSLAHFLVGGAGGGGGGSHPFASPTQITVPQFKRDWFRAGAGGSGGGGAVMVRAGGDLLVTASGSIRSTGGPGVLINGDNPNTAINPDPITTTGPPANNSWGAPCPGGGGSGGTLLLQAHGSITLDGPVSTAGGAASHIAGLVASTPPLNIGDIRAGDGAPGYYRLESRTGVAVHSLTNVPAYNPSANNGSLDDRDTQSGSRSLWRSSAAAFPPTWVRYEMQVDSDGDGVVDQLFSDDPTVPNSIGPANDPLGPVRVRFQGARVSAAGVPTPGTIRPWRDFVTDAGGTGLNSDAATGFRFEMIFNSAQFPNVVVKRLTVIVRS